MIASVTCAWCGESHPHEPCPVAAKYVTRDGRPHPIADINQTAAAGPEAKLSFSGGLWHLPTGGNQTDDLDASDLELPAFELRWLQEDTGRIAWRWLIWADGRHRGFTENQVAGSGFGLVVFNRIPQLLTEARRDEEKRILTELGPKNRAFILGDGVQQTAAEESHFWDGLVFGFASGSIFALGVVLLGFR